MNAILMLPTYNERENLEKLVREIVLTVPLMDILIIDDSSPDGTGKIADRLSAEFKQVEVMHRPPKSGRGTASQDGYKYSINKGYSHYLEMDVDFSHKPEELPRILEAAHGADLVIASRFVPGGSVIGWDWKRRVLHSAADLAVKVIFGTPNTDHTNGFRCYSVDSLKKIDFSKLHSTGYVEHTILEFIYYKAGFKISEVPSVFPNREEGESKMGKKEALGGLKAMLSFRFLFLRKGLKYFLNECLP